MENPTVTLNIIATVILIVAGLGASLIKSEKFGGRVIGWVSWAGMGVLSGGSLLWGVIAAAEPTGTYADSYLALMGFLGMIWTVARLKNRTSQTHER